MNESRPIQNLTRQEAPIELFQVFWLSGLAVSCVCFLLQIILFILLKSCRKTDEKILAQMTFARIMVTVTEYCIVYHNVVRTIFWKDLVYTVYFYVDFCLVVWMFVFSKNLYDKIVVVFSGKKLNLIVVSIFVWTFSLPFGLITIYLLKKLYIKQFLLYFKVYACIKFIIVTLNAIIYFRIFYIAFKRGAEKKRNFSETFKTVYVAFLLVLTTCLQVFVTDVLSLFNINAVSVKIFCVINSFHVVLITIIFIIILKTKLKESLTKTVSVRLSEMST
jgi:hypothetical protein